jgi:thiosulfate dehydrogenase
MVGAMKRIWLVVAALSTCLPLGSNRTLHAEQDTIDLSRWTPPDIGVVGDDPFGKLVKYGHELFTNTANEIGPAVADVSKRLAGNNLACQNCHLHAGTQPYAMPLIGVWGQFPQYRAREGMVDILEERINGCMQRSVNGRALSLQSREMRAFSSYMRCSPPAFPMGPSFSARARCRLRSPHCRLIPVAARKSMRRFARHVTGQTD